MYTQSFIQMTLIGKLTSSTWHHRLSLLHWKIGRAARGGHRPAGERTITAMGERGMDIAISKFKQNSF